MKILVAVSSNWGIGHDNDLLFRIKPDHARFKALTIGKVVVMGRKTYESIGKPLVDRVNIVLSRDENLVIPGVIMCHSLERLRKMLESYHSDDIFIVGGEKIYAQLLDACTHVYLTKVDAAPPADVFFPNIDELPQWKLVEESETLNFKGLNFRYCDYCTHA
ncbi:MAG: dihydrofolate reductase [Defluviitaleaceae bacterium]|nr:dihydrofolate reductase [Defluviitaleaceae bacterium]